MRKTRSNIWQRCPVSAFRFSFLMPEKIPEKNLIHAQLKSFFVLSSLIYKWCKTCELIILIVAHIVFHRIYVFSSYRRSSYRLLLF